MGVVEDDTAFEFPIVLEAVEEVLGPEVGDDLLHRPAVGHPQAVELPEDAWHAARGQHGANPPDSRSRAHHSLVTGGLESPMTGRKQSLPSVYASLWQGGEVSVK